MNEPQPELKRFNVMLVEDHPMFRERLVELINRESDMQVCAEADNIRDGFDAAVQHEPDLAVVDVSLNGGSGLELIKNFKAAGLEIPVLVLSMHDEALYAERVLRAGGRGYITKHEASAQIMTAIRRVINGEIAVSPKASTKILATLGSKRGRASGVDRLTDRELEVFELIGRGRTTREISIRLNLSAATVETYRARIKEKLGLENARRLHEQAMRWVHDSQKPTVVAR
ncbi:MAG: response regulator [Chthoniobacterales bacterium]